LFSSIAAVGRADRVVFMRGRRVEIWFHEPAVKREFVKSVYLYSLMMKMFESKRFFRFLME
jgi:hypothetical protein